MKDSARRPEAGQALQIAYAFLNRRERTVAEVRARLERAEVPVEEVAATIAELVELGYLDDARYARIFTEDKRLLADWGDARIASTLRERGVGSDEIEAALGGSGVAGDLERAVTLLCRRFPSGPVQPRDRERAFGVLARKGYESEAAADAVREWARRSRDSIASANEWPEWPVNF